MIDDTAAPAPAVPSKAARTVWTASGAAQQADRDPGNYAQRALGPHQRPDQVVARGVGRLASELYELPLWSDQVEPGYVVSGEPVLEAVSTAGVLGDVASDRADLLARRVGSVVVTMPRRRPGDVEVRHSGLQDGPLVRHVKFDQLAHLRQYDQDARGLGDGAARKTGARAPGNKGDVGRRALRVRRYGRRPPSSRPPPARARLGTASTRRTRTSPARRDRLSTCRRRQETPGAR